MTIKDRNQQFPALTGVRAIAAYMVFFHHLWFTGADLLTGLQLSFHCGVSLFFVLSGFLITYRYYDVSLQSKKEIGRYLLNRFARIYPVYFLILTIVILVIKNSDFIFLLQNYTLTHNLFFIFPSRGMAIPPSWSLTVEECFYLLAPLLFIMIRKWGWITGFASMLVVLVCLLLTYGDGSFQGTVFPLLANSFFGHALEFFTGIYLALYLRKRDQQSLHRKGWKFTIIGLAGVAASLVVLIYATNKEDSIKYPLMVIGNNLLLPVPVTILYYGLISERSWIQRILSTGAMQLAGRSSYGFYVLHFPLITYIAKPIMLPWFGNNNYNLFVFTVFVLAVLLSILLFVCFENPVSKQIRKM